MNKTKVAYEVMLGLTAEMLLDDMICKHRIEKLYEKIDHALATGDEDSFKKWTDELNKIRQSKQMTK